MSVINREKWTMLTRALRTQVASKVREQMIHSDKYSNLSLEEVREIAERAGTAAQEYMNGQLDYISKGQNDT